MYSIISSVFEIVIIVFSCVSELGLCETQLQLDPSHDNVGLYYKCDRKSQRQTSTAQQNPWYI